MLPKKTAGMLPADLKIALRINEAVQASGLSRTTLYKLIAAKQLASRRVGGRRLILREDLEALLKGSAD